MELEIAPEPTAGERAAIAAALTLAEEPNALRPEDCEFEPEP